MKNNKSIMSKRKALKSAKSLSEQETHDLVITRSEAYGNHSGELPLKINMLCATPKNSEQDLLFIDQVPVPRDAWSYDKHDKVLRWTGLFGGGQIHISHSGRGGTGVIGKAGQEISVNASSTAHFLCSVALNCGASYVSQGDAIVALEWDTSSDKWKSAQWINDRLLMSYTVTLGSIIEPPTFTFEFEDKETGAIPWDPSSGSFQASLRLGSQTEKNTVWDLVFKSSVPPDNDIGSNPSTGPDSVYPYWLQAVEDAAASTINGVIEIDNVAPGGTLVGIMGQRVNPSNVGYYQISSDKAPFGVFNGKIHVNGTAIGESIIKDKTLNWKNIDQEHQEKLGLPAEGALEFNGDGSIARNKEALLTARRLSASKAINTIKEHNNYHMDIHNKVLKQSEALGDTNLNIQSLLAMTPFGQNSKGEWADVVQAAVREDLSTIMNSFVSADIWKLIYPNVNQPTLSDELAKVAYSPVADVDDPKQWYKDLGTAVMTQGMSNGSDENCKNMNGPRAGAWLKEEVANSKVYAAHSQMLFQYHWGLKYPLNDEYLSDQVINASGYKSTIDAQTQKVIDDINNNVAVGPSSPDDLKGNLIKEVQDIAQYAKANNLFWAFAFYTYNTAPATLANIAMQLGVSTGSSDGTTISRLFQQNITVLTAMDPSGYFAQQYNKTINIFMATNILPSMYGFIGDENTFSLIKEYMQEFVNQNINNEDKKIADAVAQIKNILGQEDADNMLQASIEALRAFSETTQDAMALPYVANKWLIWFSKKYPKWSKVGTAFGSVLIGGITSLSVYNLILAYKRWDQLTAGQRTEIILNSIQLGLQILSAVVTRGVRIYAIFSAEGMSLLQRSGAISRILASGEAGQLNQGLMNIANNTARWLGDTAGASEMREDIAMLMNIGENDLKEVSWTVRIFGKNLDEFIATRVGPLLILAGMGLSIYFMAKGETGIALASDIINLVSGALMLFSMVGGWLIEGGIIAAEGVMASIIAIAGPLAIIAAIAGVGLMLYQMFKKQPDPVEEFVDDYVKDAGFYVGSSCSSIDYVIPYAATDKGNLMMMGFTLSTPSGKVLTCNTGGAISLGASSALPECVWQVQTDGKGMSQIVTIARKEADGTPVGMLLSLMSDNTICFKPRMQSPSRQSTDDKTVLTQTWLSTPRSNADTTNNDSALVSLNIAFQPVIPDAKGNYQPSQASGWLTVTNDNVGYSSSEAGSTLNLQMSGISPNYVDMCDLNFIINTRPSQQQTFGPRYGTAPSTPLNFSVLGELPKFLKFDKKTGLFTPDGTIADTQISSNNSIVVSNSIGSGRATFKITVGSASMA